MIESDARCVREVETDEDPEATLEKLVARHCKMMQSLLDLKRLY